MATVAAAGLRLIDGARDEAASALRLVGERQRLGRRLVGVTTVFGVLALAVLLGLALFHSALAEGQYQLSQLERDMAAERQMVVELQFELETLNSPGEVELVARGVLGLVEATNPVDLVVDPDHIGATASVDDDTLSESDSDWLSTKPLLIDP